MNAAEWRRRWDAQQEAHEPGREDSFTLMLDVVEAVAGPPARVLDLACATGSISERVLARFPGAQVTAIDVDPVTLELARALPGVEVLDRDLRDPGWAAGLGSFDAVLTATALHWLYESELLALYERLAAILRSGGVFANRDHMPLETAPLETAAEAALQRHLAAAPGERWHEWWDAVAAEPSFAPLLEERARRFTTPTGELMRPVDWHRAALRGAGFAHAEAVWRWGNDALLVAVR